MGALVCYTDTIENYTQAQGQAEARLRRTLLRRCPFCMRGKGYVMNGIDLLHGDCFERMKEIEDGSVDLIVADPPYNIGVETVKSGKVKVNAWDKIDDYPGFMRRFFEESARVLKDNGVLYMWHNDMTQVAEIIHEVHERIQFQLISFCIWDKGKSYRARSWLTRNPGQLRSWFNRCEYCLHFFKVGTGVWVRDTGTDRINSNPACYRPLKDWYKDEKERLGLTDKDIGASYTRVTGKKPYMLRHYFQDSQFEIPTRVIWEAVYESLGFGKSYDELRQEYEDLRQEYEDLRQGYEGLRHTHVNDAAHCNVWERAAIPTQKRFHTCEKPVDILSRIILVSSRLGDIVLDPFMGSGSTGVACVQEGRRFIGIEREDEYFKIAKKRLEEASSGLFLKKGACVAE